MNIPTAEEMLNKHLAGYEQVLGNLKSSAINALIEFARLHCIEQARVISEKARTKDDPNSYTSNTGSEYPPDIIVDKDSILNAYNLNKIK